MGNCVFCKILKGKAPSTKLYEDEKSYAFLDVSPAAEGHSLVIPKKHYETMDEMDEESANAVIKTTQKIGKAILKLNEGYNVNQNNKIAAGQIVPHVHYHIIPRNKGDKISFSCENFKPSEEEFENMKKKIQNLL